MSFFNRSIKTKISVPLFGAILFFSVISSISLAFFLRANFISVEYEHIFEITNERSKLLGEVMLNSVFVSETASKQGEILNFLLNEKNEQDPIVLNLLDAYNIGEFYSAIYLLDSDGLTWVSTDESLIGKNYNFRPYFREAKENGNSVYAAIGVTTKQAGYYFASSIYNGSEFLGEVVMKLKPEFIHQILNEEQDTEMAFVTSDGIFIYSTVEEDIYKSAGSLRPEELQKVIDNRQFEGIEIMNAGYEKLQSELRSGFKEISFLCTVEACFDRELITAIQIYDFPFYLAMRYDTSEIVRSSNIASLYFSFFIIIPSLMILLFLYFMISYQLRPLDEIIDTVNVLGSGSFEVSADVKTKDEFGKIANALNEMIKNLKASKSSVDELVKKRTSELEKVNSLMVGREKKMMDLKAELEIYKQNKISKNTIDEKIDWHSRFVTAINLEDGVIKALEQTYRDAILKSDLDQKSKARVSELIECLILDSRKHDDLFIKLAEKHKKI